MKLENIGYLQSWYVLDTPAIMCKLLSKLKGTARDKWSRKVLTRCRRHKREPDLIDFIHFVNDETLIVSDSIFSKEAIELNSRRVTVSSFATKDNGKEHIENKSADYIYCTEDHKLDKCNAFINQTLKDRIKLLARNKICYQCL